ncbi:hypothetical protein KJ359_007159 [Pestalotiopsis sp. 9143b]|nr:hypothetical protein KJ359_007159 [Pestalotiopsis sp. 9143b]
MSSAASSPVQPIGPFEDLQVHDLAEDVRLQCQKIWEGSDITVGEEIKETRSRTFPVTVSHETGTNEGFLFQIPTDASDIELIASVHDYIHRELDLKVNTPRVRYKNTGFDEPIGHPYLVLTRLPGQSLQEIWLELTHEQRLSVARQVGELYLDLQSATNTHCGLLKVPVDQFGHSTPGNVLLEAFGQERNPLSDGNDREPVELIADDLVNADSLRKDPPGLSARDMATLTFARRKYYSRWSRRAWVQQYTDCAVDILTTLTDESLSDGTICLWHRDISAENILVERDDNGEPKITGLLGWNGVGFAPRFMTCRAPKWLWSRVGRKAVRFAPGPHDLYDDSLSTGCKGYPEINEEPFEPFEPIKSEAREIKAAFDATVGKDFTDAAYDFSVIVARRLMYVAACSVWELDHTQELDAVFSEWEQRQVRTRTFREKVQALLKGSGLGSGERRDSL